MPTPDKVNFIWCKPGVFFEKLFTLWITYGGANCKIVIWFATFAQDLKFPLSAASWVRAIGCAGSRQRSGSGTCVVKRAGSCTITGVWFKLFFLCSSRLMSRKETLLVIKLSMQTTHWTVCFVSPCKRGICRRVDDVLPRNSQIEIWKFSH